MNKIYISTRYIYDEEGELVHERGEVLDRDYGGNLSGLAKENSHL